MKELFLDANAHVPPSQRVLKKYCDVASSTAGHGHPMSLAKPGRQAAHILESSRARIAELIGADSPNQIIFTSGATQAAEWAINILKKISDKDKELHYILSSPFEHPSVRDAFEKYLDCGDMYDYSTLKEFKSKFLKLNNEIEKNGTIKVDKINNDYIICSHLQNEIGLIQDIKAIKNKCKFLFSDMSQSLGKMPINVTDLNVDLAIFGGHKFGGFGVGFMYLKDTSNWIKFNTGSSYYTDKPGSPDIAATAATAEALVEAYETLDERTANAKEFSSTLEIGLKEKGWEIICEDAKRSPFVTFARLEGQGIVKLMELSETGVYVALGSACSSFSAGLSPSLKALNYSGSSADYIRISNFGHYKSSDANYLLGLM